MSRFLKNLALLVAIACTVWVVVLWQWQTTQRDMSVQDIVVYLGALPLTLFALALLGRWAWRGANAAADKRDEAAAAAKSASAGSGADNGVDQAERRATLQLLSVQLSCAASDNADGVLSAAAEGQPRPALDPELRDDEGLPLLTARIAGLDLDALDIDALEATVRARQPAWTGAECSPAARRALAALLPLLEASLQALQPWASRFAPRPAERGADQPALALLRVLAAWPPSFTDYEAALAGAWLAQQVQAAAALPPDGVVFVATPAPATSAEHWMNAEQLMRTLAREGRNDLLLLTACHSAIDAASVQRLQEAQRLFTTRTPKAAVPGEAAVALLLALPEWPAAEPADADAPRPVHLHRAALARRDKAIDAAGRTSSDVAQACITRALLGGPYAAATIAGAVHDADQHTARGPEALAALLAQLPHLQVADDTWQTGALNGQIGLAAVPLAVALAAAQAAKLDAPCVALSVDDAHARLALVARPAAFDLDAAAAAAAAAQAPAAAA